MLIGLLVLLANAPSDPPQARSASGEIVVQGVSLQSLADDLRHCIDAHCTPRADVIASVRYAEGLFRSARYGDAKRVLLHALDRDKSAGKDDPEAVSALYEATATVAEHEGDQQVEASAVGGRLRLLRAVRAPDNPALLRAELDEADLTFERSSTQVALARYRQIAERATAAGQPMVAANALLRIAQAQHQLHDDDAAARTLDEIVAQGDAVAPGYRLAAYALKVRFDRGNRRSAAMDDLRAALARMPQPTPILLSSGPVPQPTDPADLDYFNTIDSVTRSGDVQNLRWVDIGISIRPDGTVEGAESLRGTLSPAEVKTIASAIGKRQYAALSTETGAQYRIERWTLTADYATPIGSLIRRRAINPHYAILDITTGIPPAKPRAAS